MCSVSDHRFSYNGTRRHVQFFLQSIICSSTHSLPSSLCKLEFVQCKGLCPHSHNACPLTSTLLGDTFTHKSNVLPITIHWEGVLENWSSQHFAFIILSPLQGHHKEPLVFLALEKHVHVSTAFTRWFGKPVEDVL